MTGTMPIEAAVIFYQLGYFECCDRMTIAENGDKHVDVFHDEKYPDHIIIAAYDGDTKIESFAALKDRIDHIEQDLIWAYELASIAH